MNAIIDPFTEASYCGVCGAPAVDLVHAEECCAPEEVQPVWRAVLAGMLILTAVVVVILLGTC